MNRVIFTGSRQWTDERLPWLVIGCLEELLGPPLVGVHGSCPSGLDAIVADLLATPLPGWHEEAHPARWSTEGRAAGPLRNRRMAEAGAVICVGFIEGPSKGTRNMLTEASRANIRRCWFNGPEYSTEMVRLELDLTLAGWPKMLEVK